MKQDTIGKITWWKWGDPAKSFHLNDFPKFKNYLEEKWNRKPVEDFHVPDLTPLLSDSKFSEGDFQQVFSKLKPNQFTNDKNERLKFSYGKSYHDIIRVFTLKKIPAPDFILFPESAEDILYILGQADKHTINIVPFSGGSSVTSGLEVEKSERLTCSLNMQRMKKLLELDENSHTATFEAGIFGPELERLLNEKGFTMGHFPQSFEYSTLGGWLATRSGGQESGQYGKIEDIVLGMDVATPKGLLKTVDYPKHASGIDSFRLFIGSEGTLGVISHAKMKIHKKPKEYKWLVVLFKDFNSGVNGLQKIIQSGVHPAIVRLSDSLETKFLGMMSRTEKTGMQKFVQNLMKSYLKSKGFEEPCILMMRFAIKNESDIAPLRVAKKMTGTVGAQILPASTAGNWEENRFALPYIRETLVEHRILIDTFETVTYWKNVSALYHRVKESVKRKSDYYDKGGLLFAHLSHVYETGACIYFTLIAPQEKGNELQQWLKIKEIVTDAVVEGGGAVSHHHGIGKDHKKWYLQKLPDSERQLLMAMKKHLDPNDILNPGKLFDEAQNRPE